MRTIGIEYPAQGTTAFCDLGEPGKPGPSEILIRTEFTGITNGTERHALMGEHVWAGNFPSRHGYQHVGIVEACGDAVTEFSVGQRVFHGHYVGHRAWNMVDVADPGHLTMPLPTDFDPRHAALLGVAGVGMRGSRRTRIGVGMDVWCLGGGPIGQFAAQSARAAGARVTMTEIDDRRLTTAKELGAHRVLDAREDDIWDRLKETGQYHVILDSSGVPGLLPDIFSHNLLPHAGVIGLLAVRSDTTFPWSMLHGTEASIEVSCHFELDDLRVLIDTIQRGVIQVEPLITHTVGIDDAVSTADKVGMYDLMRDNPRDLLGVVFDWS
jgi:2-desacetyl-2-hydroxyethyl bacteriochlorophyllide A dehydrogenase